MSSLVVFSFGSFNIEKKWIRHMQVMKTKGEGHKSPPSKN
jgi:hypothetical protein